MITHYYTNTINNIITAMTVFFKDLKVVKFDASGAVVGEKAVPITQGSRETIFDDRTENHYIDADNVQHGDRYYLQLPRIAISFSNMMYDSNRAAGINQWRTWDSNDPIYDFDPLYSLYGSSITDYQPTPFNFNFDVSILSTSMDYTHQLIENIAPYFNPSLQLKVKEFSFLNVGRTLQVDNTGWTLDYQTTHTDQELRYCNATTNFVVRGNLYRPFVYSKQIQTIHSKYLVTTSNIQDAPVVNTGLITSAGESLS